MTRGFALPLILLGWLLPALAACSPDAPPPVPVAPHLPASPLPPCPASPNCVHETRLFDAPPDTLFQQARAALQSLGALQVEADARRLDAVFKVFFFKDDVALAVAPHDGSAVLHIRSASRVGHQDFGVNRRRVARFFEALAQRLG